MVVFGHITHNSEASRQIRQVCVDTWCCDKIDQRSMKRQGLRRLCLAILTVDYGLVVCSMKDMVHYFHNVTVYDQQHGQHG